jgi:PAS domain S-box-containing protein
MESDDKARIKELEREIAHKERLISKLQEKSGQYFALLEKMPSLAWIKDDEHRLTYLNPAFESAFGIKREEWLGKSGWDLFPEEQARAMAANDQKVFDSKDKIQVIESVTLNNKSYYYLNYKFPFSLENTKNYIGGISIDITTQVETEADLTKNFQEQRQLQEIKDKFMAFLSHDVRSPLANFNLSMNLLEDELRKKDLKIDLSFIQDYVDSSENIMELLDNLISWYYQESRHLDANPERVDLKVIFESCLSLFNSKIQNKVMEVEYDLTGDLAVDVDRRMIFTILRNLISNAVNYGDKGSKIKIGLFRNDDDLSISITSFGQEIKEEKLKKIFQNLWETTALEKKERGFGLGLSICKEFAKKNRRRYWV